MSIGTECVKDKKAIFIIGIGDKLKSGDIHGKRSPDYDDWSLDGDLLVYDKTLDKAIELSKDKLFATMSVILLKSFVSAIKDNKLSETIDILYELKSFPFIQIVLLFVYFHSFSYNHLCFNSQFLFRHPSLTLIIM